MIVIIIIIISLRQRRKSTWSWSRVDIINSVNVVYLAFWIFVFCLRKVFSFLFPTYLSLKERQQGENIKRGKANINWFNYLMTQKEYHGSRLLLVSCPIYWEKVNLKFGRSPSCRILGIRTHCLSFLTLRLLFVNNPFLRFDVALLLAGYHLFGVFAVVVIVVGCCGTSRIHPNRLMMMMTV